MIAEIITFLTSVITKTIAVTGYFGILILMILESAGVPIPSEIIMPYGGYLVFQGRFHFLGVVFVGSLANLIGSLLAYYLAKNGGRDLLLKIGKYFLFSRKDLEASERFFGKYGAITVFISRMLPVFRTYISFPAGFAQMEIKKFIFYTFLGSIPWCFMLTYLGIKAGENWLTLRERLKGLEFLVIFLIIALIGVFLWRHLGIKEQKIKKGRNSTL